MEDTVDPANINDSLLINYRRKVTTYAEASCSNKSFTQGSAITITADGEEKSIGSVGDRARTSITPTLSMEYSGGTSSYSTFESLFDSVITSGLYAQSWKYQGVTYSSSNYSTIRTLMISNVKNYLESIPTTDGSVTFSADTFKSYLSYSACTHYTYTEQYDTQLNIYQNFISRYNAAYAADGGYILYADLGYTDGHEPDEFQLALNVTTNTITAITLPDDIEF